MIDLHPKLHHRITYYPATLALLLFLALSFSLSTEATAQNTDRVALQESPEESVWKTNLGKQYARLLYSPIRQVREDALATMIGLAQKKQYSFEAAVPSLLGVYSNGREKEQRMAATALMLIGDEAAIEELMLLAEKENDGKVRKHTQHALALYYVTAYPELAVEFEKDRDKRVHIAKVQSEVQKIKRDRARALRRG